MSIQNIIPNEFIRFLLVLIFSLLIGLEQRRHHITENEDLLFGTDRTFTFIGLLGYVLFIADPKSYLPFLTGFVIIGLLLAIQYFQKISQHNNYGLTSSILALLTYCLPIMVFTQPIWLLLSFVVVILILTEIKNHFISISKKASEEEFITLAKFIAFAGVLLPLLPDQPISDQISISPYNLWLAVVVVSGISYISYLLKKFVFPDSGIILTGILGGLYSSTATTVIIARREKKGSVGKQAVSAIMIANGMMYLRILVLAFLFNRAIASVLAIPFLILFVICIVLSKISSKHDDTISQSSLESIEIASNKNPLEFKTAAVFGLLFVFFAIVTEYVMKSYGSSGITTLAFIVGVTDIDPFLLNLLQHQGGITETIVALAIINATNSNNILKLIYALTLSSKSLNKSLIVNFSILIISGLAVSMLFYLL
ncbi:MAG TPA: DUF4010 domain-containing protein [Prolixibacteraceae bacterium]|nr:DUF4010 domain-containing protein [Prolixibacteraceae bacterium]